MFIPKHLKEWQPEHMKHTITRRCHWCTSGPHRLSTLIQVLEAPMRFHFCSDECVQTWQQRRHDAEVVPWLKEGAGVRAEILKKCSRCA
jgi:hypothetical protein